MSWITQFSWATAPDDLFLIEIEVSTQTEKDRETAAQLALLRLLTKVTGIKSIPRIEEISAALRRPSAFYSGFSYKESEETLDFTITYNFDKNLVLDLVKKANLPYWWSNRPKVLVWLALDDGSEKILSSSDSHVMHAFLQERAEERGISLELPIMDVPDRRLISYKELKAGIAYRIDEASHRYLGDVSLIGKARASEFSIDQPYFDGSWEFWIENELFNVGFTGVTAREGARIGVDLVADTFAAKYALFSSSMRKYDWIISGINNLSKYADLKNYFESLEIIDEFFVSSLSRDQVRISISSRASEQKIKELLVKKKVIFVDPFHRGPEMRFRWGEG